MLWRDNIYSWDGMRVGTMKSGLENPVQGLMYVKCSRKSEAFLDLVLL